MSDDFFNFSEPAPAAEAVATPVTSGDFLGGSDQQDDFFGAPEPAQVVQEEQGDFFSEPAPAQEPFFEAQPVEPQQEFFEEAPQDPQESNFFTEPPQAPQQQDDFFTSEEPSELEAVQEPEQHFVDDQLEEQQFVPEETVVPQEVEPEPEPQPIELPPLVKWEIQNREEVAQRDQIAAEKEDKLKKEANEIVAQFYAERKEVLSASHDRNTGSEAEFCKQRDALFSHGEVWERVVSLIDLKATNEKKPQRVGRMRQLLLHMKNEAK